MRKTLFVILCVMSNIVMAQEKYEYRYWFDASDKSAFTGISDNSGFHIEVDTSPLATGLHSLNCQIKEAETGESSVKTAFFYKTPSYLGNNSIVLIDGRPYSEYSISGKEPSGMLIDIDTDSLALGIHTLGVQIIDDSGVASSVIESFFVKVASTNDIESMNFHYIIDDIENGVSECAFADGIAYVELDMSSLSDGLHTITFFMGNDKGMTTQAETASFTKESEGGETGITVISIESQQNGKNTVYDLQGRRTDSKGVPGIYIIKGKKILVR